jgi:hydroxyethylthiazole kinase-like uncharacterized protein yjeF
MLLPAPLFKRRSDTHKADFGHVFILAGSTRYTGAACLCAEAVMRSGAGLATLGVPRSLYPIAATKLKEVMVLPLPETAQGSLALSAFDEIRELLKKASCILMGPGLSQAEETKLLIKALLLEANLPMVIDADGLNAIAEDVNLLERINNPVVLTPHPKEMARLTSLDVKEIQANRKNIAKDFALRYNITLVLKGHGTIVTAKDKKEHINTTGNPGMATAGSGDVLSGIIAAFLAQGLNAFEAAKSAVFLHGTAGDLAAKDMTQAGLIASDIINYLPKALKRLKPKKS